jgi:hypothetical protein
VLDAYFIKYYNRSTSQQEVGDLEAMLKKLMDDVNIEIKSEQLKGQHFPVDRRIILKWMTITF